MAANIHMRAVEEDYEIAKKIEPKRIDFTAVRIKNQDNVKGKLKLSLSITYFFALVYFLVKLVA